MSKHRILSAQQYEVRLEKLAAFQKLLKTHRLSQRAPRFSSHRCSNRCELWNHGKVWICMDSGDVHVCSESLCDSLDVLRDARVCRITALAYSLEYDTSDPITGYGGGSKGACGDGGGCDGNMDWEFDAEPDEPESAAVVEEDPVSFTSVDIPETIPVLTRGEAVSSASKDSTGASKKPEKRRRVPQAFNVACGRAHSVRVKTFTKRLQEIFALCHRIPNPDEIDFFVHVCESTWVLIVKTIEARKKAFTYRLNYHPLVIYSVAAAGFRVIRENEVYEIVPPMTFMRHKAPDQKSLKEIDGVSINWVTRAEKFFNRAISSVTKEELRHHVDLFPRVFRSWPNSSTS
jgi:hypothetical protein